MKIRKWDKVQVTCGKDKGLVSEVLKVIKSDNKVIVKGAHVVKRHIKKSGTTAGQIIEMEKAIDASNVMVICPVTEKPTRIGMLVTEEKGKRKKSRYSKAAVKSGKAPKDCIIK